MNLNGNRSRLEDDDLEHMVPFILHLFILKSSNRHSLWLLLLKENVQELGPLGLLSFG